MKISQAEWSSIRQQFLRSLAGRGIELTLRDRVWAVTSSGEWVALPGTSDSPDSDKWWLGVDPEKLLARSAIGVILLCKSRGGPLHAVAIPRALLNDLDPKFVRNRRQIFFNVARRGGRFLLQLRGGEEIDVTGRIDNFSWLGDGEPASDRSFDTAHSIVAEGARAGEQSTRLDDGEHPDSSSGRSAAYRFFAIVKNKSLHPLDDVALEPGSVYLVEVRQADAVPGNSSLRRIVARGGPQDLPSDFAERHDYYAHGAGRR